MVFPLFAAGKVKCWGKHYFSKPLFKCCSELKLSQKMNTNLRGKAIKLLSNLDVEQTSKTSYFEIRRILHAQKDLSGD